MSSVRPGHGPTLVTRPPRGPPREGERNDVSNAWNPAPRPDPSGTPVGRSGGGGTLGAGACRTRRGRPLPGLHRRIDVPRRSPHDHTLDENSCPVATLADLPTQDRIDPDRPRAADLDEVERLLAEALAIRSQIVRANLRLVVSIAKRQPGPRDELFERVSDGNYVLIRAVERFDYSLGNKFSTYATWAIRNNFARAFRGKARPRPQSLLGHDEAFEAAVDPRTDDLERSDLQERRQEACARLL